MLKIYEALQLRSEYKRKINAYESVTGENNLFGYHHNAGEETIEPVYDEGVYREHVKKLKVKLVKLNQAIQIANFNTQLKWKGEDISLSEALEVRKSLLEEEARLTTMLREASYKTVYHKDNRDIESKPKYDFIGVKNKLEETWLDYRKLVNTIHELNHTAEVPFNLEE